MPWRLFLIMLFLLPLSGCLEPLPPPEEIETSVRNILELPTYEYIYRDIVYLNEKQTFLFFPLVRKTLLFSIDLRVQAGFDLSKGIDIQPFGINGLRITLPPASILLIDADEESIHQYFLEEYGDEIGMLEYYDEIDKKKPGIIEDSVNRGILEEAEINGIRLLSGLFKTKGFSSVEIQIRGRTDE
jgi:hypothetical protein